MQPESPHANSPFQASKQPQNLCSEDDWSGYSGDGLTDHSSLTDLEDLATPWRRQLSLQTSQLRQLRLELEEERAKTSKMTEKLNFLKENQEIFLRLKEAYVCLKYNEAAGRRMIEVREKSAQTWEGAICPACVETEALRRQFEVFSEKYSRFHLLERCDMEKLLNTVRYLKDLLERREEGWRRSSENRCLLQSRIAQLEAENERLRNQIPDDGAAENSKQVTDRRELEQLRRIVLKYRQHCRRQPVKISPLNEEETALIDRLVASADDDRKPRRARSPLRLPADAAILNLDRLFD